MSELFTFLAVLGLDFGTKKWADETLPLNRKKEIVRNHLYFWHIKNSGIAYNRFSGKRKEILVFTGGILAYYSIQFVKILRGKGDRRLALPLAMTLGGGLGNFLERLRKGSVTDFLFIPAEGKNAPIFNIADIFIWMGAVGLAVLPLTKNAKK